MFNGMFPVVAGKEHDARAFAAETMGARRADYDAARPGEGPVRQFVS